MILFVYYVYIFHQAVYQYKHKCSILPAVCLKGYVSLKPPDIFWAIIRILCSSNGKS